MLLDDNFPLKVDGVGFSEDPMATAKLAETYMAATCVGQLLRLAGGPSCQGQTNSSMLSGRGSKGSA